MAQERSIFKAQQQLDQIAEVVRQAVAEKRSMDEVERELWQATRRMGLAMLEGFVAGHGSGDVGPTIEYEGHTLGRFEQLHDRRYVSVFGELTVSRSVYGTRETQKHQVVPLDAVLNLPDSEFGYLLQQWDQSFCVQNSYGQSRRSVQEILELGQSVRTLEHMNVSMAGDVEAFHASQAPPPEQEEGAILVLTADGKGVPMRRDPQDAAPASGRLQKGQKANKKREACVGAVYTIEPFKRTPEDVVDEVMRQSRAEDRPKPQHKKVRAELSRTIDGSAVKGKERIFSWFKQEVTARNSHSNKDVVCVMDGDRGLWKMLGSYLCHVVCILDLFHVMERLWAAAHCFHPEGSDQARTFVTDRLERILHGEVGRVIGGLKQMATKSKLRGSHRKRLQEVVTYLENNRQFMHYDAYLAKGYPIGSGVVEGACRHLVKDRMELAGMHWRTEGAQSMLHLRAVYLNDEWEPFQRYRSAQESDRLYPYRAAIIELMPAAAA
jgi:hypothetical protein